MLDWPVDIFRPPLGWGPTLLLLVAAAALGLYVHFMGYRWAGRRAHAVDAADEAQPLWQRAVLMGLRVLALVAVAWMLAGPSRYRALPDAAEGSPIEFLADTSASMNEKDAQIDGRPVTRWESVRRYWLNPALHESLRPFGTVRVNAFDHISRAARPRMVTLDEARALMPSGKATDLFAAVDAMIQGPRPGLLVVLSDGHDTERASDPALLERLRTSGWRVVAVPVGASHIGRDLALSAWADADRLFDGQSTAIHAAVSQMGFSPRLASVKVDLLRDGQTVESREVPMTDLAATETAFRVTPRAEPGKPTTLASYQVVVRPAEGEKTTENNQRWVFLQVQRERIRVALLEAQPYWDTRFLAQTLRDDAQVDLTAVYGLGPERTVTTFSAGGVSQAHAPVPVPLPAGALKDFDVVILGKGAERFFPGATAQALVDFVQSGGALVLARGQAFDAATPDGREAAKIIAPMEPVEWGRETLTNLGLEVTEAGRGNPLLDFDRLGKMDTVVTRLPDMLAATKIQKEKSLSVVLLRQSERQPEGVSGPPEFLAPGHSMAAVAYQNAGSGRVLAVLTDGLWRWAFLPSRLREFDSVYQMFWSKAVRWLAGGGEFLPGQSLSLTLGKLAAEPDEVVSVSVATRYVSQGDFQPRLRLLEPGGGVQEVTLTRASDQSPRYEGAIQPRTPGVYEVELQAPGFTPDRLAAKLAVYNRSAESLDTSAQPQNLADISDASGGECLPVNAPGRLVEIASGLKRATTPDRTAEYVFDRPVLLVAIGVLWSLDWFFRRRWGRA